MNMESKKQNWAKIIKRKSFLEKEISDMLVCDYIVKQIDGEYAHLQNVDNPDDDKLVARALLPDNIAEGTKLHYEMLQYEVVNE